MLIYGAPLEGVSIFVAEDNPDQLNAFDSSNSYSRTVVGAFGVSTEFGGLAYDPDNDLLYMVNGLFSGTPNLYTVNQGSGAAVLIGPTGVGLTGLAYDYRNDVLYGAGSFGSQGIYSLNPSTGAASLIGVPGRDFEGLTYNGITDQLVGMVAGDGDLYEIDRSNGSNTLLVDGAFVNSGGLAYDSTNNVYFYVDDNGGVFTYDPTNNFSRTTIANTGDPLNAAAFAGPAVIPEPGVVVAVAGLMALFACLFFRRE